MKNIIYFLVLIVTTGLFCQCKKGKAPKLENPLGLLLLGSDTSLPDGRYIIRTANGCTVPAATLRCDYTDDAIGYNGSLPPIDHITINDIDSSDVWYVKKVRYVSPDPDYALAFGYRIYQRMPDGGYRFLALTATASTVQWTDDEIGFTYAIDDRAKSVKAGTHYLDRYPSDPAVPTSLATSNDTIPEVKTRYLFQLYASEDNQGAFFIKLGGISTTMGNTPIARWNFCLASVDDNACDASNLYPHFRDEDPRCQTWRENSVDTRRCYIREYYFQKVY